jgi:hypothetical protein
MAFVLEPFWAAILAAIIVVGVILVWKFLKFAFRVAVIAVAIFLLFWLLRFAEIL